MYKEKKFHIRPVEEILEDIDMARDYYGPGLKRVFLMDGDAVIHEDGGPAESPSQAVRHLPPPWRR